MIAAMQDEKSSIKKLLEAGANPSMVCGQGKMAEDYARMVNPELAGKL